MRHHHNKTDETCPKCEYADTPAINTLVVETSTVDGWNYANDTHTTSDYEYLKCPVCGFTKEIMPEKCGDPEETEER